MNTKVLRRQGFTLVELMVVISLTVFVMSIGFAGLQRARTHAYTVICQSNLRQIGMETQVAYDPQPHKQLPKFFYSFQAGNSGNVVVLVQPKKVRELLAGNWDPYSPELMVCPADLDGGTVPAFDRNGVLFKMPMSYGYNVLLGQYRMTDMQQYGATPENYVSFFDGSMSGPGGGGKNMQGVYRGGLLELNNQALTHRHPGGYANVMFMDWHIEMLKEVPDNRWQPHFAGSFGGNLINLGGGNGNANSGGGTTGGGGNGGGTTGGGNGGGTTGGGNGGGTTGGTTTGGTTTGGTTTGGTTTGGGNSGGGNSGGNSGGGGNGGANSGR